MGYLNMSEVVVSDRAAALAEIERARLQIDEARQRYAWLVSAARYYGFTLDELAPAMGAGTRMSASRQAAAVPDWHLAPEDVQRRAVRALGLRRKPTVWRLGGKRSVDAGGPAFRSAETAKRAAKRAGAGVHVWVFRPGQKPKRWVG